MVQGPVAVDVDADQNFIGQSLKGPPNEGLKHITGHVDLGEVPATLGVRISVVGGHEVLQPRLHHDFPKHPSVKRPAKDNL